MWFSMCILLWILEVSNKQVGPNIGRLIQVELMNISQSTSLKVTWLICTKQHVLPTCAIQKHLPIYFFCASFDLLLFPPSKWPFLLRFLLLRFFCFSSTFSSADGSLMILFLFFLCSLLHFFILQLWSKNDYLKDRKWLKTKLTLKQLNMKLDATL